MKEKLFRIQQELNVPKSQYNNFGGYKFRSCEDILTAVKPLLKELQCILTLEDELMYIGNRYYIKATAMLIDLESDDVITNVAYAREEETKKGMDGSQITGASSSYARKYALNGLFGIDDVKDSDTTNTGEEVTKEKAEEYILTFGKHKDKKLKDVPEDYLEWLRDSNKTDEYLKKCCELLTKPLPTEEEQKEILELMAKINDLAFTTNTNLEDITKHYEVESTSKMSLEQLKECVKILESKLKQPQN